MQHSNSVSVFTSGQYIFQTPYPWKRLTRNLSIGRNINGISNGTPLCTKDPLFSKYDPTGEQATCVCLNIGRCELMY